MEHDVGGLPIRHRSSPLGAASRSTSYSTEARSEESSSSFHDTSDTDDLPRAPSFLRRGITSVLSQRKQSATPEEVRGPLGLRLLASSADPQVDLIFVHGLRGGSIKTWQRGDDPRCFWPKHWLSVEPEFRNASIHSFGYDSDWGSSKPSFLDVHDFGRALYEEMRSSPALRQNSANPILLIGHSMGGLVIKKAYLLALEDGYEKQFSERIRCMFFLATPHRGSDYAAVLNRILKASGIAGISSKEYLKDLTSDSISAKLINHEFGKSAHELLIYSYYETQETNLGVSSGLIVDRDSAVLGPGFRNERVHFLAANHRNICKFQSVEDSNYISFKNTLATAVSEILRNAPRATEGCPADQLPAVHSLLQPAAFTEEHSDQLPGSCQWIEERGDFINWKDSPPQEGKSYEPSIYWVNASPGAGKTVLAGHIATLLAESGLQCSTHFFHFGKKASHSLSMCFRSIAYQMASSNAEICNALFNLESDGCTFDQDDARSVWLKVFKACIFQVTSLTPYYWILDGIDECTKYAELFALLKGTTSKFPLRIFLTSRKLPDMHKISRYLGGMSMTNVEIPIGDTMRDIELYVRNRVSSLPIDREEDQDDIASHILAKSGACFLWVRLVMDELESVFGYESILEIIQGIPEGMVSYYRRTILEMAKNKRERHIAQGILLWVVSAARPLTVKELSHALQLDIKVHLPSAKTAIEGLCGNLVCVDTDHVHKEHGSTEQVDNDHGAIVHIIHNSAGEFLLTEDAEEFQISRSRAHERIALACLRLLVSPEMQPPRNRRLLNQNRPAKAPPVLLEYAITQFSEHVYWASSKSDEVLIALNRFLTTTILSWVERLAARNDLRSLIRTARNLKAYLDRRAKYRSPLNNHVSNVDNWATDLGRLATKFGTALASSPQSIYFLIPPLCPTNTGIYRQFGRVKDGLVLSGDRGQNWDDCVATVSFGNETVAAVAAGNNVVGVGFDSGNIHLFDNRSFQKEVALQQALPIDLVYIDPANSFVAACSRKFLTLWDVDGTARWKVRIRGRCILLTSSSDYLLGITGHGYSLKWDVVTGEELDRQLYEYEAPTSGTGLVAEEGKAPFAASVSPGLELVALAYRNSPVCLFELESGSLLGWAIDEHNRSPQQLLFNPNPDVGLLLVAYNESHLALYDSWSGSLVLSHEPEKHAIFNDIACSPDGRTLATVDILGNLRIWDFESLSVLYHVLTPGISFRLLHFTSDGLNMVDLDDDEMRVWSPSALVRKNVDEEASTSDQASVLPVTEGQFDIFRASKLTVVAAHDVRPLIFAGNQNGEVLTYDSKDGRKLGVRYSQGSRITHIALTRGALVASGDENNSVRIWDADISSDMSVKQEKFRVELLDPIHQVLFDTADEHLLVSTIGAYYVYSARDGNLVARFPVGPDERTIRKWAALPLSSYPERFALLANQTLYTYTLEGVRDHSETRKHDLSYTAEVGSTMEGLNFFAFDPRENTVILGIQQRIAYTLTSLVHIFRLEQAHPTSPCQSIRSSVCRQPLSMSQAADRIFFLHQNHWVSSMSLSGKEKGYTQHFTIPPEFVSGVMDIAPVCMQGGGFVFCTHDKLVIVQNGLTFEEEKALRSPA